MWKKHKFSGLECKKISIKTNKLCVYSCPLEKISQKATFIPFIVLGSNWPIERGSIWPEYTVIYLKYKKIVHFSCINKKNCTQTWKNKDQIFALPSLLDLHPVSPPIQYANEALHLPPLLLYIQRIFYLCRPSSLPSVHPSFPPEASRGKAVTPQTRLPAALWYNSIRFACWPRSGTSNLFSLLIIIGGINKFGWKTTPWTLTLYPRRKFIFYHLFLLLGDKWCLLLCLLPCGNETPLAEWGTSSHFTYVIWNNVVSHRKTETLHFWIGYIFCFVLVLSFFVNFSWKTPVVL